MYDKLQEGKKKSLLAKPVIFRGRQMPKSQMVEEMASQGGRIVVNHYPKYIFNRAAFNRMDYGEQAKYEAKLKVRMPFAVEFDDGTFYEITQTEAEYFSYVLSQLTREGV